MILRWFQKKIPTPPFVISLHRVLRELVGIMASSRAEVRSCRKQLEEMRMQIDALSENIQKLVDAASAQKQRAKEATQVTKDAVEAAERVAASQQPQIDELNSKVVAAIEMLTTDEPVTVRVTPAAVDPNAPVT